MQQINSIGPVVSDEKSFKDEPNLNKLSAPGGHVEFPIDTKKHNFCRAPSTEHPCQVSLKLIK